MEKQCFKCGEVKPLHDFYAHPYMPDGHVNKCKECNKKDVRENRLRNIDYYRAYDAGRANKPDRVMAREKYRKTEQGKSSFRKSNAKWTENNEVKRAAQIIVNNAVKNGRLLKPAECSQCGSAGRIHGHHCDYAKPLDVMWLCPKCHAKWHKENGEAKNG